MTRIADTDSYIVKYYYVTFWELFNGGLGGKLEELLAKYPRYDFLVRGFRLYASDSIPRGGLTQIVL